MKRERPTRIKKAGIYKHKAWRYELVVAGAGSKSEELEGRLSYQGEERLGVPGETITTPIARFAFFNRRPYLVGWLGVMSSGGAPVFDDDGKLSWWALDAIQRSQPVEANPDEP